MENATTSTDAQAVNPLRMRQPKRPFRAKANQWCGEFYDANGSNLGGLYKTGENEFRVYRLREFGNGEVELESTCALAKNEIERSGCVSVSASQRVRYYRLKMMGVENV